MLSLKNITKSYTTGDFSQVALNGISLNFREKEFVAILGASGSGKTTFLNVVGGLDRYDSGDLIINGKSTKQFKDKDWDAYRNNSIGFVFQSYNLISHLSILDNVEMGMTLSGVRGKTKRQKALEVLEKVGLKEHTHKKPNQLSGGQMQRVAIARALANDPDIILADEPTGALDTKTSVQIMDLIKEIAKDKLVIMVTHNSEIANKYADRIIQFKDGEVISDSNPLTDQEINSEYQLKKTGMGFFTALKLSATNIWTKKGRTLLTAFASSIGIIFIALVLSLSNGFDKKIAEFESGALSTFPIMISQSAVDLDEEMIKQYQDEWEEDANKENQYPDEETVFPKESMETQVTHMNKLDGDYLSYLEDINPDLISGLSYSRALRFNLLNRDGDTATLIDPGTGFYSYPKTLNGNQQSYLEENYDVLAGSYPGESNEIALIIDQNNHVDETILKNFGFDIKQEQIPFEEITGTEYRIILNNDFYKQAGNFFTINGDPKNLIDLYHSENAISLNVTGVLRAKESVEFPLLSPGFVYSDELAEEIIMNAKESEIVKAQEDATYNVLNGETFDLSNSEDVRNKEMLLTALGAKSMPSMISIYPKDFEAKEKVLEYLDEYNEELENEDKVIYNDLAKTVTDMSGSIMNGITVVLVAFSAISLIVSVIMVGIITYISVLERTKEIGILRALGARKKDITRVFNAETFIIGVSSGVLGIVIAYSLIGPINNLLEGLTDLPNIARLNPVHAAFLIVISLALTVLGGFIPAKMAAKKDPVEALRTE